MLKPLDILRDPEVQAALIEAWTKSNPGLTGGHEEGGFILWEGEHRLTVRGWRPGEGNRIRVPDHRECLVDGLQVVATFHTHPNTGLDYLQEPSETDKRGVNDDADLKGRFYVGEFVIAEQMIYLIVPSGAVQPLGSRSNLLG